MKWPPYLLQIKIINTEHSFSLWIPLFILGPIILVILLALLLIALPFIFLSFLFTWEPRWWRCISVGIPALFNMITSLPGSKIDVEHDTKRIAIVLH